MPDPAEHHDTDPVETHPDRPDGTGTPPPAPDASRNADKSNGDPAEALTQLRHLLLGPEQQEIETIRNRIDNSDLRADDVADVLPDAVSRSASRDDRLAKALGPSIGTAIKTSIKKDPKPLVDAIFPIIGPAIRRSISDALAGMLQSLNEAMEHSFSVQGLRWRLEAAPADKPFAEVVLLHTLKYRVEQVFLIHAETGLLLRHVGVQGAHVADERMVSGMITAIQDFVRDSFGGKDEQLDRMRVGGMVVRIERGPSAVLAAVIRGTPPPEVQQVLQETIELVHADYGSTLEAFEGDVAPFDATSELLEACLLQATQKKVKPKVPLGPVIAVGVLCLLVAGLVYWRVSRAADWAGYVDALRATPGLVVVEEQRGWFTRHVRGLRDPLAEDPVSMLETHGIAPDAVRSEWRLYTSLDQPIVDKRNAARPDPEAELLRAATAVLDPPAGVVLSVDGSTVVATGDAVHRWMADAEAGAGQVPGLGRLDLARVTNLTLTHAHALIAEVERTVIAFDSGQTALPPGREGQIAGIASRLIELNDVAGELGAALEVRVTGHSDPTGDEALRQRVSQARADYVLAELKRHDPGLPPMTALGVGSTEPIRPDDPGEADRRVSFMVDFSMGTPVPNMR